MDGIIDGIENIGVTVTGGWATTRTPTCNSSFQLATQKAKSFTKGGAFFFWDWHSPSRRGLFRPAKLTGSFISHCPLGSFGESLKVQQLATHHYQVSPGQQSSHHPSL